MDSLKVAAFFDLDRTLLKVNSGSLWLRREWRHKRIGVRQLLEGSYYLMAYKFRVIDMKAVTVEALKTIKGEREETVREWTREWFSKEVAPLVAPKAWEVLREHRLQGDSLILLTSSSPYASELACAHFGLEAFVSTRYEVEDGLFTGMPLLPLCYGEGKVILAREFARKHQIDLEKSFFYTDSFSDLPMLKAVGHPRVVHPDLRLRLFAWKNGWPILDWH